MCTENSGWIQNYLNLKCIQNIYAISYKVFRMEVKMLYIMIINRLFYYYIL